MSEQQWTWADFWYWIAAAPDAARKHAAAQLELEAFLARLSPEHQAEVLEHAPTSVIEHMLRATVLMPYGHGGKRRTKILHPQTIDLLPGRKRKALQGAENGRKRTQSTRKQQGLGQAAG